MKSFGRGGGWRGVGKSSHKNDILHYVQADGMAAFI
jgi:uncharacterized protein YbdZ (MbtH family)